MGWRETFAPLTLGKDRKNGKDGVVPLPNFPLFPIFRLAFLTRHAMLASRSPQSRRRCKRRKPALRVIAGVWS